MDKRGGPIKWRTFGLNVGGWWGFGFERWGTARGFFWVLDCGPLSLWRDTQAPMTVGERGAW